MYLRFVKVPSSNGNVNEYVRVVEAYRQDGKVKQRTIADLGRKDVLTALLPQLQRLLAGQPAAGRHPAQRTPAQCTPSQCGSSTDANAPPSLPPADDAAASPEAVEILQATTWGPVLVVRALFEQLGLWQIFEELLGKAKEGPSYSDRAFVLLANRLIRPASEHGLARWLETDFVCDRHGRRFLPHWHTRQRVKVHFRQLRAWYRTLDRLIAAKSRIEVRLYERLRDLFSLQPDLVLFDITSTYFEGAGPVDFAKHGYSRDGKPQNVQVVVGLVMVGGWPIAHHVWAGNQLDVTSVPGVIRDLMTRFQFARIIFVGDRGMISEDNIEAILRDGHGYLLGLKRRRNAQLDAWLQTLDERRWLDCPMGITAREKKTNPPRTRVQEVASGEGNQRVFVIDSDERRQYEQSKRQQAMERTRLLLDKVKARVADGRLTQAAQVGAAAERALRPHKGYRYFDWKFANGVFEYFNHPIHLQREQRLEGKYVIATSEKDCDAQAAVALYKQLIEVEHGFRHMKDVLAMRPIYHQVQPRVRGHIFVAALALLLQTLLDRRLAEANVDLSATQALQAVEIIRHVTFNLQDEPRSGVSAASARAQEVLTALGLTNLRPPTPPAGDTTVM